MSIATPPEKISDTLQCAGGFRNGYSDHKAGGTRQKQQSPENRSFFWRSGIDRCPITRSFREAVSARGSLSKLPHTGIVAHPCSRNEDE
ncbi:hypothetical protein [Sphingomonas yabuuchiae]|uniref:hypothetical protein n=1 Tax=Sphingomonas yabuuchiae TaxID=172044 RepID=UPI0036D2C802